MIREVIEKGVLLLLLSAFAYFIYLLPSYWLKFLTIPFSHSDQEWENFREGFWIEFPDYGLVAIVIIAACAWWLNRKGLVE